MTTTDALTGYRKTRANDFCVCCGKTKSNVKPRTLTTREGFKIRETVCLSCKRKMSA